MALTPEEYLLQSKVVNGGVDENPGLTSSANPDSHSKLNTTEKKSTLKAVNEIVNSKNSVATTVNNILDQIIGVVGDWVSDPALESDMKLVGDNILDAIDKMGDSIESVDSIPKVIFENTHLKVIKGRIKANDVILTNGEVRVMKDSNSFELLTDDVVYSKEAQIHNFIENISFVWENAKKCVVNGKFVDIDKHNIAYIDSGIRYEAPIDFEGNFSITVYFDTPIQFNETAFISIGVIDQISNTSIVISSLNTSPMNYVDPIVETSTSIIRNSIISSDGLSFIDEDGSVQLQNINIDNTISLNSVYYSDDIYYNDLEVTNTMIPIGNSVVLIDNSINGDTSMNDTLNLVDDITINSIEIL